MVGQPSLDIDLEALPKKAVVMDIVYSPLITPLLEEAKHRSNSIINGIGMLLHQARPGFRQWFGKEPEVTKQLEKHVLLGV
jgi:shikimate dehydrogenase